MRDTIEGMIRAGRLVAETLQYVIDHVKPGITTEQLDKIAYDYIIDSGAYPAPLNYNGYPKSICTSVNNVICHGVPNHRKLRTGDIISIDVTVILNGYHGDTCKTVGVGNIASRSIDLINKAE